MKDSSAQSRKAQDTTSFYHHSGSFDADANWYLIDQAKHPEALRLLFEQDPVPVYDLPYIHSQYREQAFDGPLIIQPATDNSDYWLRGWLTEGKALAMHGPQLTLEDIRNHFVSLNTISAPYGDSLFRYADPATLGSLGASFSPHQRLRVLGPLTAIHGHSGGANWSLVKIGAQAASSGLADIVSQPLVLTKENLAAVEHYRQHLLSRSLARSHGLEDGVVSCWFQQLISLGASNEQALVEGAELLIRQGFTRVMSQAELATVRKTRQGAYWSGTLETLATFAHSQEGT